MKRYRLLKVIVDPRWGYPTGSIFTKTGVGENGAYTCGNFSLHPSAVENNPEWFEEVIEQPTEVSKEFVWTDELVKKYAETSLGDTIQDMGYFKETHLQSHTPTEQAKERITVTVVNNGICGEMVSIRPNRREWEIPKEKNETIKKAIEYVINDNGTSDIYSQSELDKAIEDAFCAARRALTSTMYHSLNDGSEIIYQPLKTNKL